MQEGPVVVVADTCNDRLSLWRLGDGTVWKHLGSQGSGPGQFIWPQAVAVTGDGFLVVTDQCRVQVLALDGTVLCVLGPEADIDNQLDVYLYGVTVCAATDEIVLTDYRNQRVVALAWLPPSNVRTW